jgi:hypothetical protein
MADDDFSRFVKRQQGQAAEPVNIDWDALKNEWIDSLRALYKQVEKFLSEYIESGDIRAEYDNVILEEDNMGRYDAPRMHLWIGPTHIDLSPIGTLLIGTRGRVDMHGPRGLVRLILADRHSDRIHVHVQAAVHDPAKPMPLSRRPKPTRTPEWVWKIVARTPPVRFLELNEESFTQAIMEIADA